MAFSNQSRQARIAWLIGGVFLVLVVLTIPFRIWPIDLAVQSRFFRDGEWFQKDAFLWKTLYVYGTLPTLMVVLVALVALVLSFGKAKWVPWRKAAAYLVLCLVVGPGLIINAGFKENWGRPRPRAIEPFGGQYAHERVFQYDASSPGKSFPCGHCSMGFYFFAAGMLLGTKNRRWGWMAMAATLVLGVLIGMARVAQGGHFLSDVLWSGGFCLLTSLSLFYALGLDRSLFYVPAKTSEQDKMPLWVKVGGSVLGVVLVLGVALATPYHRDEHEAFEVRADADFELSFVLEGDRHEIAAGEGPYGMKMTGDGFGLPGSAVKNQVTLDAEENYFQVKQRMSGFFTELEQVNHILVPASSSGYVKVVVGSGDVAINLSALKVRQTWKILCEEDSEVSVVRPISESAAEKLKLSIERAGFD